MSDIPRGVTTAYNAGSHDSGLLDGIFHALVYQVNNHLAPAWRWKLLALHQQREGLYGVVHFSKGDLVLQLFVYMMFLCPLRRAMQLVNCVVLTVMVWKP